MRFRQLAEHFHRLPRTLGPEHLRRSQMFLLQKKKLQPNTIRKNKAQGR
ncbi:hypothetical protein ACPOL_5531 [Acidisarcina polymorpha]|uniref:Uncharacterized protein n=1 Tax=Acidisarcina polymorpha TaxID=2211140 RepID=A0A2Z5G720_9BACT|nr:hypothetical protein ACPOL_5531 [Acidisarcina polymorpha]